MLLDRPFYTDRLTECIDDRAVKILTGARRSGKSCIMKLLAEQIKNEKNDSALLSKKKISVADLHGRGL